MQLLLVSDLEREDLSLFLHSSCLYQTDQQYLVQSIPFCRLGAR